MDGAAWCGLSRMAAVRYLIDHSRLDGAEAILDGIKQHRPNPLRFPDREIGVLTSPTSGTEFTPRNKVQEHWREFDTLR